MPTLAKTAIGTVTALWGVALIKQQDGTLRPLEVGDAIRQGDVILTDQEGIVQINGLDGTTRVARADTPLDRVIEAVESGQDAPGAGAGGSDAGSMQEGFRVARISEPLSDLELRGALDAASRGAGGPVTQMDGASSARVDEGPQAPPASGQQPQPQPQPQPKPQPQPQPQPHPDPKPQNQSPVAQAATVTVHEDMPNMQSAVAASDPDANDAVEVVGVAVGMQPADSCHVGVPIAGVWGTLTLHADGSYAYAPLPAAQQLVIGQTVDDVFTYTVADSTGATAAATLTVHVVGADDPAVIAGGIGGAVTEDGVTLATGRLTVSDPDSPQAAIVPAQFAGGYGSFAIAADGTWTYTLDNGAPVVQSLREGQTTIETFSVASADGTSRTVSITVHGADDVPVIGSGSGEVTEDLGVDLAGHLVAGGTLPIVDADAGESSFEPQSTSGLYGTFVLAAGGAWTYRAVNAQDAIQSLRAGQSLTEAFPVLSSDGTMATVGITIHGANDAPAAVATSFSVLEDAPIVTGAVVSADPDAGATLGYEVDTVPPAGLAFNSNGSYGFDPSHAAYQALGVGQSVVLSVPYTVTDEHGAAAFGTLSITVVGTNDAPAAQAASFAIAKGSPEIAGAVSATDVDANATLSFALDGPAPAGLAFNADGTYGFDPTHAAYQALGAGQSMVLSVPYTVIDDQGATSGAVLAITVTGTNFAPIVASAAISLSKEGLGAANADSMGAPDSTNAASASGTLLRRGRPGHHAAQRRPGGRPRHRCRRDQRPHHARQAAH